MTCNSCCLSCATRAYTSWYCIGAARVRPSEVQQLHGREHSFPLSGTRIPRTSRCKNNPSFPETGWKIFPVLGTDSVDLTSEGAVHTCEDLCIQFPAEIHMKKKDMEEPILFKMSVVFNVYVLLGNSPRARSPMIPFLRE